jgi:hypothetical protein
VADDFSHQEAVISMSSLLLLEKPTLGEAASHKNSRNADTQLKTTNQQTTKIKTTNYENPGKVFLKKLKLEHLVRK